MRHYIKYAILLLTFTSCGYKSNSNSSEIIIYDKDFPRIDTFRMTNTYDIGVYSVNFIAATKEKIVIGSDDKKSNLITIFSKDMTHINSFGKYGRARNEFIMPNICAVTDEVIHIADQGKGVIQEVNFNGEIVGQTKLDLKTICQEYKLIGQGVYIGDNKTRNEIVMVKIDSLGINPINELSIYSTKFPDTNVYWGCFDASPNNNIIIYAPQYLKEILILSHDGNIKRIIKREPSKMPILNNEKLNKITSVCYYWRVQILENSFIACSINKTREQMGDNYNQYIELEEYDYEGNPIRKIVIDQLVHTFYLDGDLLYAYLYDGDTPFAIFKK